jgi:hypothetical protein
VDTRNSQKKSPRSSAKSKQESAGTPAPPRPQRGGDPGDEFMDRSVDHVARVRAAREAAQREMESFGDVAEYDITIIQGQSKEQPVVPSQPSLGFESEQQETD